MSSPVQTTLAEVVQEAEMLARRAIDEDYPDLVYDVRDLVALTVRLADEFGMPPPLDPDAFMGQLKKRFVLSTREPVAAGIFSAEAIAVAIDPTPLRRGSAARLGVGLADQRERKIAIDAPCYDLQAPCYGLVVATQDQDEWFMVREAGDLSYVMLLEHEWIRGYGVDMVIVKSVLGVGRDALSMAEESRRGLRQWMDRASKLFQERYARLSSESNYHNPVSFYHFGRGGFCRHPWDNLTD
ncbi:MAG: hypothetical protein IT324_27400 [Anaerolineae bacterium]|nr:hypothetical protein [Anaerolineae bacterium]